MHLSHRFARTSLLVSAAALLGSSIASAQTVVPADRGLGSRTFTPVTIPTPSVRPRPVDPSPISCPIAAVPVAVEVATQVAVAAAAVAEVVHHVTERFSPTPVGALGGLGQAGLESAGAYDR